MSDLNAVPISISMDVDIDGSEPVSQIVHYQKSAWLHLKRKASVVIDRKARDESEVDAIAISAGVGVKLDEASIKSDWEFGFIQLVKHVKDRRIYAGIVPDSGSVSMDLAAPPAWPAKFQNQYCLDTVSDWPFTQQRAPMIITSAGGVPYFFGTLVRASTFDHPAAQFPLVARNRKSKDDNYLYLAERVEDFVTAFVYREKATKKITILANLSWHVAWSVAYRWANGECNKWLKHGQNFLTIDDWNRGAPSDASVASLITNPNPTLSESANELMADAYQDVWGVDGSGGGPGWNESESSWPSEVVRGFYKV